MDTTIVSLETLTSAANKFISSITLDSSETKELFLLLIRQYNVFIMAPPADDAFSPVPEEERIFIPPSLSSSSLSSKYKIHPEQSFSASAFLNFPDAVAWRASIAADNIRQRETARQINRIQIYTPAEEDAITAALGLHEALSLKGIAPFKDYLHGSLSTTSVAKGFFNKRSGDVFATADYTVRGRVEVVAAYICDSEVKAVNPAYGEMKETLAEDGTLQGGVLEHISAHSHIIYQDYKFPSPLIDREVIHFIIWKRLSANSVVVVYSPLQSHPLVDDKDGGVMIRAQMRSAYLITQLDAQTSRVQYSNWCNFGGRLPAFIAEGFIVPATMRNVNLIQTHLQMYVALKDIEEVDGRIMGEMLVKQVKAARATGGWKKRGELGKVGVDEFLYVSVAMRELLVNHPWLRALLHQIVLNAVSPSNTAETSLADVTEQDAVMLGKGLVTIILCNTQATTAVDHWVAQNTCLAELEAAQPWMRAMFIELAQFSLSTSNLGMVLRVAVGAVLSTVDLVSDVYMTAYFLSTPGLESYGHTNATLIGLTLIGQLFVVHVQNGSKPAKFLKEALMVFVGLKPAYDAWKIGSGAEKEEHQVMSPLDELSRGKFVEMVGEAVPSSVIRKLSLPSPSSSPSFLTPAPPETYALLSSGNTNKAAIVSLIASCAATAFTSTTMSYDWDTSPEKRKLNSANVQFYGFVPDKAAPRACCFIAMLSFAFAHTLAKSFSTALLAVLNITWLAAYLIGDVLLFCLVKAVRGDLRYGLNLGPVASGILTVLGRTAAKVMIDFTALLLMRHPGEAGGLTFTLSLVQAQIVCFVSCWLYLMYYEGDEKLSDATVWTIVGGLGSIFFLGGAVFLFVIDRDFMHTFFDTDTCATFNRKWFRGIKDGDDEQRSQAFSIHPAQRKRFENELHSWTLDGWERFEQVKPSWFTDRWIDSVPNDMIPFKYCVKYKKTKGRRAERRGSTSLRELVGGEAEAR